MGRKIHDTLQLQISRRLEAGESAASIWRLYKDEVSQATVYRMELNYELFGDVYRPSIIVQGRPRSLLPVQEQVRDK